MKIRQVQILFSWLCILTALFTFSGCGKGQEAEALAVSVRIPEGEAPELFWFGVDAKILTIENGEQTVSHHWGSGQRIDLNLKKGDRLVFFGYDREGRLLVTGESMVSEAKTVSIPLRRVL